MPALHGHRPPERVEKPERSFEAPCAPTRGRPIARDSVQNAPPAFVRHGAFPDLSDLDARGGRRACQTASGQGHWLRSPSLLAPAGRRGTPTSKAPTLPSEAARRAHQLQGSQRDRRHRCCSCCRSNPPGPDRSASGLWARRGVRQATPGQRGQRRQPSAHWTRAGRRARRFGAQVPNIEDVLGCHGVAPRTMKGSAIVASRGCLSGKERGLRNHAAH